MTIPDVSARYTAREALDALAKVLSELGGETLIMISWQSVLLRWHLYDSLAPWFAYPGETDAYVLSDETVEYPFAQILRGGEYCRPFGVKGGIWAALDSQHRDVVIKLVPSQSDELKIATKLSTEPMKSDPNNFIVPILDVLQYNAGFSFLVMPRWSQIPYYYGDEIDCLETLFCFATNMLQTTFLHDNGIVHRDTSFRNVLVNYNGRARHIPPANVPPSQRVIPASDASWGELSFHPPDVLADGDAPYDPFPFDVACMGGLLCVAIGPATKAVPLLAPFLDGMITPHIQSRFTASEALGAFTKIMDTLSQEFLRQTPAPPFVDIHEVWQNHDRWDGLPDDFVKKHAGPDGPVRPRRKKVSYTPDGSMSTCWVEWNVPEPRWL
ncbi:hypothetical protein QCA50_012452 [Cerrena zonata]|uniref:Protein kinase domain-containing protein n=1 Tax=Cerrena zonata TaxID=2478898 RepID=A0AAW0G688_9APHY